MSPDARVFLGLLAASVTVVFGGLWLVASTWWGVYAVLGWLAGGAGVVWVNHQLARERQ